MADEYQLDLQQIFRQPHPSDGLLRRAISESPIAKKALLLRSIRTQLDKPSPLSESILHNLEHIRDLDRAAGGGAAASMKLAYCDVAVACTMKHLGGEGGGFAAAVERIWKGRVERIERADGLFSEELWLWRARIEKATTDQRVDYADVAVKSVERYLESAFAAMELPVPMRNPVRNPRRPPRRAGGGVRKMNVRWDDREVAALLKGIRKYGTGRWQAIREAFPQVFVGRRNVDLKDKWRNMKNQNKHLY